MLKALIAAVAACCAALLMIAGQAQAWAAPFDGAELPPTSYTQFVSDAGDLGDRGDTVAPASGSALGNQGKI